MAKYRIKDTVTGKIVTVSGNTPPTQSDAEQIFKDAGLRDNSLNQDSQSRVPDILKTVLPIGGGILGGIAGGGIGALAGGIGAPVGAVAGGGLGTAAGQAGVNLLERAMGGTPPATSQENLKSLTEAGTGGALAEATGLGMAKLLGLLAHPIKPFTDMATNALKKSTAKINIQDVLNQLKGGDAGNMIERGFNNEVQKQLPIFESNLKAAIQRIQPSQMEDILPGATKGKSPIDFISGKNEISLAGTPNETIKQVGDLTQQLPQLEANAANLLKSAYQKGANGLGAYDRQVIEKGSQVEGELKKKFATILKSEIENAVPGVKVPNKIASLLYSLPNTLEALTYLSPSYRGGMALRRLGSAPFQGVQKVLPYGGGYLNTLFPALFNLPNFPQQQSQ